MDNATYTTLITNCFNTIFNAGAKIFAPNSNYISDNEKLKFITNDINDIAETTKKRTGVDIMNVNEVFGEGYCIRTNSRLFDGALTIIPDFKPIVTKTLEEFTLNHPSITFGVGNDAQLQYNKTININALVKRITLEWNRFMQVKTYGGTITNNKDFKKVIGENANIDWLVDDNDFLNLIQLNNFFNMLSLVHNGYAPESLANEHINKLNDALTSKFNEYAERFVKQFVASEAFIKKALEYVEKFENALFLREKGMKPDTRVITINYAGVDTDDRISSWENRGRSGQDNIHTFDTYLLVEYKLNEAVGGVRKKRTQENAANFFKMNTLGDKVKPYLEEAGIEERINANQWNTSHFVFANRENRYSLNERGEKNDATYRYVNDFYESCEYMLLQVPLKWNAIGQEPTSVANFLPDMGVDMDMNFSI